MNTAQARDQALRNAETWSIRLQAAVAPLAGCSRDGHRRGCRGAKWATRLPARGAPPGRGHRPCHSAAPGSGRAGGPKPPASARPAHGGRWPLCRPDRPLYGAPSRAGGGSAGRVSWSHPDGRSRGYPVSLAGAIAPATAPRRDQDRPGAQSPRPAPAPPSAGASRPPGRALASVPPGPAGLQGTFPRGRGNALRFLIPPALAKALPPLQWQGPSPLPQRCAGIRTGRGPKPPASARPALGGRFAPAGSGAGLCVSRTCRSTGHRRAGARETRCVSCSRPEGASPSPDRQECPGRPCARSSGSAPC